MALFVEILRVAGGGVVLLASLVAVLWMASFVGSGQKSVWPVFSRVGACPHEALRDPSRRSCRRTRDREDDCWGRKARCAKGVS